MSSRIAQFIDNDRHLWIELGAKLVRYTDAFIERLRLRDFHAQLGVRFHFPSIARMRFPHIDHQKIRPVSILFVKPIYRWVKCAKRAAGKVSENENQRFVSNHVGQIDEALLLCAFETKQRSLLTNLGPFKHRTDFARE